jgi:hypothetical protein
MSAWTMTSNDGGITLEPFITSNRRNAIVAAADGSVSVIDLPRVSDCSINKLFEVADHLPDNFGIVIDAKADSLKIFKVDDALCADFLKGVGIDRVTTHRTSKDQSGEILYAENEARKPADGFAQVGDNRIAHLIVQSVRPPPA